MPFVLLSPPPPPSTAREVEVGSYLPPSPTDPSFVVFQATPNDTPALRAGNHNHLSANFIIHFCSTNLN